MVYKKELVWPVHLNKNAYPDLIFEKMPSPGHHSTRNVFISLTDYKLLIGLACCHQWMGKQVDGWVSDILLPPILPLFAE